MSMSPIAARMHDAALEYIAPRMQSCARVNFRSAFDGVTERNFRQRLPEIVGAIVGRTANDLAYDASIPELQDAMKVAAQPNAATPQAAGGATPSRFTAVQIEQVLKLLQPHVDPATLDELRELLGYKDALDRQNATGMGEDSRYRGTNGVLARQRIEKRLGVTLPKVEPRYGGHFNAPPARANAYEDFSRRFPEAKNIKHA